MPSSEQDRPICQYCGGELIIEKTPNLVHYAKLYCSRCNRWVKWIENPDKDIKRPYTSKIKINAVAKYHKMDEPICFLCLRKREQLGNSETLTQDYIIELDKGGEDIVQNQQILCTACHKLKNWCRLYMHWHHLKEDKNGESCKTDTG